MLLSNNEAEHQLGNLIADVVKGRPWEGMSEVFIRTQDQDNIICKSLVSYPGPKNYVPCPALNGNKILMPANPFLERLYQIEIHLKHLLLEI